MESTSKARNIIMKTGTSQFSITGHNGFEELDDIAGAGDILIYNGTSFSEPDKVAFLEENERSGSKNRKIETYFMTNSLKEENNDELIMKKKMDTSDIPFQLSNHAIIKFNDTTSKEIDFNRLLNYKFEREAKIDSTRITSNSTVSNGSLVESASNSYYYGPRVGNGNKGVFKDYQIYYVSEHGNSNAYRWDDYSFNVGGNWDAQMLKQISNDYKPYFLKKNSLSDSLFFNNEENTKISKRLKNKFRIGNDENFYINYNFAPYKKTEYGNTEYKYRFGKLWIERALGNYKSTHPDFEEEEYIILHFKKEDFSDDPIWTERYSSYPPSKSNLKSAKFESVFTPVQKMGSIFTIPSSSKDPPKFQISNEKYTSTYKKNAESSEDRGYWILKNKSNGTEHKFQSEAINLYNNGVSGTATSPGIHLRHTHDTSPKPEDFKAASGEGYLQPGIDQLKNPMSYINEKILKTNIDFIPLGATIFYKNKNISPNFTIDNTIKGTLSCSSNQKGPDGFDAGVPSYRYTGYYYLRGSGGYNNSMRYEETGVYHRLGAWAVVGRPWLSISRGQGSANAADATFHTHYLHFDATRAKNFYWQFDFSSFTLYPAVKKWWD